MLFLTRLLLVVDENWTLSLHDALLQLSLITCFFLPSHHLDASMVSVHSLLVEGCIVFRFLAMLFYEDSTKLIKTRGSHYTNFVVLFSFLREQEFQTRFKQRRYSSNIHLDFAVEVAFTYSVLLNNET